MMKVSVTSAAFRSQSPQFLTPSATLQGFSHAKSAMLRKPNRTPPIHAGHCSPNTFS